MRIVLHVRHIAAFPSPGHKSVRRTGSFDHVGDRDGDGDFCPRKCCGCHIDKRRKQTEAPEGVVDILQELRRLLWRAKPVPCESCDVFVSSETCVSGLNGFRDSHKVANSTV